MLIFKNDQIGGYTAYRFFHPYPQRRPTMDIDGFPLTQPPPSSDCSKPSAHHPAPVDGSAVKMPPHTNKTSINASTNPRSGYGGNGTYLRPSRNILRGRVVSSASTFASVSSTRKWFLSSGNRLDTGHHRDISTTL